MATKYDKRGADYSMEYTRYSALVADKADDPNSPVYAEFDEDTNCHGVFGVRSGFCYFLGEEEPAEIEAAKINKEARELNGTQYHVDVFNDSTGQIDRCTSSPVTHDEGNQIIRALSPTAKHCHAELVPAR